MDCKPRANNGHLVEQVDSCSKIQIERSMAAGQNGMLFFDGRRKLPMSEPTKEELLARIAELEKQSAAKKSGKLEFKIGEKGGMSVYGLGRFPVTLYYEQWTRLLDAAGDLRAFLEGNKNRLKLKKET